MSATAEHYAKEAYRLLNDEVLAAAFETVRLGALRDLAAADAFDAPEILRLQAMANCLQQVRDALEAAILAAGGMDGGVILDKPPA